MVSVTNNRHNMTLPNQPCYVACQLLAEHVTHMLVYMLEHIQIRRRPFCGLPTGDRVTVLAEGVKETLD